jgi:hypothetical protein
MAMLNKKHVEEIVGYLQSGQDLPENFKNILFPPERREYELVYDGKDREEDIIANTWGGSTTGSQNFQHSQKCSYTRMDKPLDLW